MFGHYIRSIDDKNRIGVPAKFKKELGGIFYATIGPDHVIELRDKDSFNQWKEKLISANMLNANARKFARILLGNTVEITVDKQNRMSLPNTIANLANLTKEVAFVGVGNKVEIWSKETFDKFQNEFSGEESIDSLAKKLLKDGVEL